jgi:hypothetical protein
VTVAGAISGRVSPGGAGRTVVVERLRAGAWSEHLRTRTAAGGRYRAAIAEAGVYRVRYRGEAGPAVRVQST